jgi:hypothetical protein
MINYQVSRVLGLNLFTTAVVYLLTNATSSIVREVSAIFVANMIFLTPFGGLAKTRLCSDEGIPECNGKIVKEALLLNGVVLSKSKDNSEMSCHPKSK